jgi:hypothetical protein
MISLINSLPDSPTLQQEIVPPPVEKLPDSPIPPITFGVPENGNSQVTYEESAQSTILPSPNEKHNGMFDDNSGSIKLKRTHNLIIEETANSDNESNGDDLNPKNSKEKMDGQPASHIAIHPIPPFASENKEEIKNVNITPQPEPSIDKPMNQPEVKYVFKPEIKPKTVTPQPKIEDYDLPLPPPDSHNQSPPPFVPKIKGTFAKFGLNRTT